jgi:hypothetical protein
MRTGMSRASPFKNCAEGAQFGALWTGNENSFSRFASKIRVDAVWFVHSELDQTQF